MFKRLMIGLVAVGVVGLFIAETANAWTRYRRSVAVTVYDSLAGASFDSDIFGLPAEGDFGCGEIKGDVYCSDRGAEGDTACNFLTGYSAALVLIADGDLIKPRARPYNWSHSQLNSDLSDFGQRTQLRVMQALAGETDPDPTKYPDTFVIELPTGKTDNKAGIYAIHDDTVNYWREPPFTGSDDAALRRFIGTEGTGGPPLTPDCGFGISCPGISTDQYLQSIPVV